MTIWFHSTILATSIAATIAVGLASAAKYESQPIAAPKGDFLMPQSSAVDTEAFVTVEARGEGVSVLARVPADIFVN
jgi:hypothetical protein